jgi:acyl-coenzyme A synthetase/AMP-(fatty) acid ligase
MDINSLNFSVRALLPHPPTLALLCTQLMIVFSSNAGDAENAYPYKEAVSVPFQDLRWSFKTLREYAESTAKGFFELGFRKGNNIVTLLPGNMERLNAQAAASLIGAHVITLDASFANANDLAHVLKDTQTRGLIFDERFGGKNVRLLEQMIPCLKEGEDGFDQSPCKFAFQRVSSNSGLSLRSIFMKITLSCS